MRKIVVSAMLLISLFLCSCGNAEQADGIDSITYISEMGQPSPSYSLEPSGEEPLPDTAAVLAEYEGTEYSSSLWLLFLGEALDNVLSKYDIDPKDASTLDVLLDNGSVIKAADFCETYARNEFEWVCLLYSDYLKSGSSLSESAYYRDAASKAGDDYKLNALKYSKLGIGLNDLILYYIYTDLYYENFVIINSPGSENAIPDDVLSVLMENNMRKISYTYLPFYNELTNENYSEKERAEMVKLSEGYLDRYRKGEAFSDIITENYMLLDSYNLTYDPEQISIYYSISDPMLPSVITDTAEKLKDYEAALVKGDDFVSVVLRLPVNGDMDSEWRANALAQAYLSRYGDDYAESMSVRYDMLDISYNSEVISQLTLENYIKLIYAG